MDVQTVIWALVTLIVGLLVGGYFGKTREAERQEQAQQLAQNTAASIIENAERDANAKSKEIILEAKEAAQQYRTSVEDELKDRRSEVVKLETRSDQREEKLDQRENNLNIRYLDLNDREKQLETRTSQVAASEQAAQDLIQQRNDELVRVAALSREDAKEIILQETEQSLEHELAVKIRLAEQKAKDESDRIAKEIILQAIERSGADTVTETTVSVVHLPSDDMKGRIIGKEGRNIKTLESLTGIDLIVDDTPEAVVLSGFDPIRREIAKIALERLIADGRIHPAKIEEAVEKSRKEVDSRIRQAGEEACFEVGVHSLNPDLIKILGRLNYRTSYGQNVLNHSVEVAKLAGVMAGELGEDVNLAKRAGLLHDIGKALDHEVEGSHVQIGTELAMRYNEHDTVINAIASHHGDTEATSVIANLVAVADALSAARPGARSESLENYIQRLRSLEAIANDFPGIQKAYAIQAGREIRVMVKPDEVDDLQVVKLAHDISQRIETELDYPGQIKVTLIREKRAVSVAK
ncbi:ribonuclease Y [Aerococcus urinaehominis]|uniref:Ribonuclease Y n=1 Tax=Aerococcus urinaehominis TaxID=128944 RepID=A0A0X8FLV1_9LACT|nr:ribonuclease Y [Aerococcus urinaehominis]AMB99689.1 ribonuclease Y [Aerococcus urinaehominis]SDL90613.1 ribonucrease Y [Aerococcus urinaehominis]